MSVSPKPTAHPSYLELDRHHAAGAESTSAALREHLAACERCTTYLAELRKTAQAAPPDWLTGLEHAGPSIAASRREMAPVPAVRDRADRHSRRSLPVRFLSGSRAQRVVLLSISAAAAILFFFRSGPVKRPADRQPVVDSPESLREKGEPAIAVYLKRDERVWLWDGQTSVRPGDKLRLKILAAGYEHVTVAAPAAEAQRLRLRLRLLYSGRLEPTETLLPKSWEIDAQPGAETLYVFLSRRPLTAAELPPPTEKSASPDGQGQPGAVWQKRLVLPKAERESHVP